jgi:hypothetical protein
VKTNLAQITDVVEDPLQLPVSKLPSANVPYPIRPTYNPAPKKFPKINALDGLVVLSKTRPKPGPTTVFWLLMTPCARAIAEFIKIYCDNKAINGPMIVLLTNVFILKVRFVPSRLLANLVLNLVPACIMILNTLLVPNGLILKKLVCPLNVSEPT